MITTVNLSVEEFNNFKSRLGRAIKMAYATTHEEKVNESFLQEVNNQVDLYFGDHEFKRNAGRGNITFRSEIEK